MSRAFPAVVSCTLFLSAIAAGCARRPPLAAIVAGGSGPPTFVLLHGYGSSAEGWAPFTQTIRWAAPGRFVFPQGPEVMVRTDGASNGRAWWPLDLPLCTFRRGGNLPDLSTARPPGTPNSLPHAPKICSPIAGESRAGLLVLGGFSQGAMVASEVAFPFARPALPRAGHPLRGRPSTNGRGRVTTTIAAACRSSFRTVGRTVLFPSPLPTGSGGSSKAAGLQVTWCPFDGGHEMPATVVGGLDEFLARLSPGS